MAFKSGDSVRLKEPVPTFAGTLPAGFRLTVLDAWPQDGRELLNAFAGEVGVSCLEADRVEPAVTPERSPPGDALATLARAGWLVSREPYVSRKHAIFLDGWPTGKVRATWDLATERFSVWGVARFLTLAETLEEYSPARAEAARLAAAEKPAAEATVEEKPAPAVKPRPAPRTRPPEIAVTGRTAQRSLLEVE